MARHRHVAWRGFGGRAIRLCSCIGRCRCAHSVVLDAPVCVGLRGGGTTDAWCCDLERAITTSCLQSVVATPRSVRLVVVAGWKHRRVHLVSRQRWSGRRSRTICGDVPPWSWPRHHWPRSPGGVSRHHGVDPSKWSAACLDFTRSLQRPRRRGGHRVDLAGCTWNRRVFVGGLRERTGRLWWCRSPFLVAWLGDA